MPIYEYQCQSCQKVFEYMQRMSEDPKTECEECKGRLDRLISNTSFSLKGGGWYKDLYSSTKKDAGASSSGSSSASTGTSTSADVKPASDSGASKSSSESASPAPAKAASTKSSD